jgi:intein/homing endonuclease
LFEKFVKHTSFGSNDSERLGSYYVYSKPLVDFMLMNGFIPGCHNKRIPAWVYESPRSVQEAFINGYVDADGNSRMFKGGITEAHSLESCNRLLIEDFKELIDRMGWSAGLVGHRYRQGGHIIDKTTGRTMPDTESWTLYFTKNELLDNERILGIEEVCEDLIYDVTVENDVHNITYNGVQTHQTRAPEKRIFSIPVGNIPADQVPQYIELIARQMKKHKFVDPATGQVNERWSPLIQEDDFWLPKRCLAAGAKIPLLDSRIRTLAELISEYGIERDKFWVYSWNGNKIIPALAKCVVGPKQSAMVRVKLDNGEYIDCTPDHKFYLKNGKIVNAVDLKQNDSLYALYKRKFKLISGKYVDEYVKMTAEEILIGEQVMQSVNHNVVSVEFLEEPQDTYCLEVEDTHCFFVSAGVLVHNSDGTGPTIDTLPGAENLDKIADIEYFKKKMIAGFKIPFSRVGIGDQAEPNGKSLAAISPEFAKSVQWIQREAVVGLKKLVLVHLALRGCSIEEMRTFDLAMTSASAIDELYRIETWNTRADVIKNLQETKLFPDRWILERFAGEMTDDEIRQMQRAKGEREELETAGAPAAETYEREDSELLQEYLELVEKMPPIGRRLLIDEDNQTAVSWYVNSKELDGLIGADGNIVEDSTDPIVAKELKDITERILTSDGDGEEEESPAGPVGLSTVLNEDLPSADEDHS